MVIFIIVAVVIAAFSIYDAIVREINGDVMSIEHNSIIEYIKYTDNKELRNNIIEFYLDVDRITIEEANGLYK